MASEESEATPQQSMQERLSTYMQEVIKRLCKEDINSDGRISGSTCALEQQFKFYEYGRKGVTPPEWAYLTNKIDPEWEEYQRLRKKFERKG